MAILSQNEMLRDPYNDTEDESLAWNPYCSLLISLLVPWIRLCITTPKIITCKKHSGPIQLKNN